ncbi:hypothetical protein BJF79_28930 [Actinomadura sp. CNU-125]|uniref:CRISPR system precrRNA processing endoribonuclease RAMP protein Cas6 n=1 Tax=Actinomadura sp. CNU-125 TaxID=1904961 RepID=UPI000969E73C|nr:CRISPR system precrRNA processing endoribonuclease RAMP protein Cas6 [Actinomadura sp. CNU-125]OLT37828.1 hypothetical protein BJF79_28930 [Actinomadura sp. CNU-125]
MKPPKAYTLTPLLDERNRRADASSKRVRFEVAVLQDELVGRVLGAVTKLDEVRVARCRYRVEALGTTVETYRELCEATRPETHWVFKICTPVAFFTARDEGVRRVRPFPEAEWVFSDLYRRWTVFVPDVPLDASVQEAIVGNLEVDEHRLTTTAHLLKAGAPLTHGSVGTVGYRLADSRRVSTEARTSLDALARFALYAGIGDRTNIGMGHVLPLSPRTPRRR